MIDVERVYQKDEDIDYATKRETMRVAFFRSDTRAFVLNTTCYDDMKPLGMDPLEINIVVFDRKSKVLRTAEMEDLASQTISKQIYSLKVGLGRKINQSTFEKYLSSKDCSYGESVDDIDL